MTVFSPIFLEKLRASHDPRRWPGVLAHPDGARVRDRLDLALSAVRETIREPLTGLLTSLGVRDQHLGRALLWSLAVAGQRGAVPVRWIGDGIVELQSADGRPFRLATLMFHTGGQDEGAPADVERLVSTLESAFGERPFALYVRRPLAPDFDPDAIFKAVQIWTRAVDRGDWRGRHAVYDDGKAGIELTLLELETRSRPLVFQVGPSSALERLSLVDAHLQALFRKVKSLEPMPLVSVLVADPCWGLTRGYLSQLVFGTPDEVVTQVRDGRPRWLGRFASERYSLFADSQFERLAAMWWFEGGRSDPLGFAGWALENPWCADRDGVPVFPGVRMYSVEDDGPGVRMTWDVEPSGLWEDASCILG